MEKRKYITTSGATIMLPATDERVMSVDELLAKYSAPKKAKKSAVCPNCNTYCFGDCKS